MSEKVRYGILVSVIFRKETIVNDTFIVTN